MVQWLVGLTRESLRRHYQVVPIIGTIALGVLFAGSYTLRLATRCPDVSWDKRNNPEPWQKLGTTGQYKFYSVGIDYKDLKQPEDRPDI